MTTALLDAGTATLGQLDTYHAGTESASTSAIFGGDGTLLSGNRRQRRQESRDYQKRLIGLTRLYRGTIEGDRRATVAFQEAMSRSDFTVLFGDIIDRQLLAAYQTRPVQWPTYAKRGRVRDFRTVKRFTLDGGEATLNQVKELAPYKVRSVTDNAYTYAVAKYGDQIAVSWETMVNDDLDALTDLPTRLGNAARRTEEKFAAQLFSGAGGPDGTFFSNANRNLINATVTGSGTPTNPPLSITGLQYAMQTLGQQKDTDGGPIYVEGVTLVVPPALEVAANNIINATEILAATGGGDGTGRDQLRVTNWMRNRVSVVVNPWLPIVNTTNGNTAWYVFANPNVGRPAMELGFLIGHETPELWVKSPNAMRVGGGPVAPEEGDFEHDAIQYRVRMVLGGTLMDPKSAVASLGTGA
ncbi:Mu-like prophage major head subunit gpT family protein [Verrucosispora sp. NA02020]|uniref:phage major capsid protein n=1 Tax=Verrucosispora sp. NA02020 TaxID=2742132 RepID=UPI0015925BAF|nr:Mu-like prophage major head subunit gpT family protein [Verrucosispora sp. NA02020]QKW15374.1 Mu-like prophage major head subunit gpT family protein [Verrucosispora sp. NA02020]